MTGNSNIIKYALLIKRIDDKLTVVDEVERSGHVHRLFSCEYVELVSGTAYCYVGNFKIKEINLFEYLKVITK